MATSVSSPQFGVQYISEFRIVLLGNRGAGKTSLANMMMCRQTTSPKRTAHCVKMRGVAAGRLVTVVDTPGWWKNFLTNETPEFQKQELVLSIAHCPPGPHAILLVIRVDLAYKEKSRRSAQEHLQLIGGDVWKHTIVVFTYNSHLQEQAVEQHAGIEGEVDLQRLISKCGNRYLVINVESYVAPQISELLERIEDTVVVNGGCHYEMDRKHLYEVREMRRAAEMRAGKRRVMMEEQREVCKGQFCPLSHIRMVLVGYRRAGKTSFRKFISGRENSDCKRTAQCVKTQCEVEGRLVTVIDTPGWWKCLPARDTPELDKQEILLSMSLCPPGPHAVLLSLRLDTAFTEEVRKSISEHMDLLGQPIWRHTMILFTHSDSLGDVTVEQYIESEGKDLELLIAQCGNRYHVVNNKKLVDGCQITQLLKKVEEMLDQNGGLHYELPQRIYKELNRKRKIEKKAKMRRKISKQKWLTSSVKGVGLHCSEISLVLLGYGEAGKTSAGNSILGTAEFGSKRTSQCMKRQGMVAGTLLTVVDTPGWWKHLPIEQTPQLNKQEIAQSVCLASPGPIAFLLVVRLDSSFQEEERTAVEGHLKLFGHTIWEQTMVLFTCGDWLGDITVEMHIESESEALKLLLEKCGNRYHVLSNKDRHGRAQVMQLLEKVEQMLVENRASHSVDIGDLKKVRDRRTKEYNMTNNEGVQEDTDSDDVFITDIAKAKL